MGRLKQASSAYAFLSGNPFTTVYSYDAASNRTGLTDPSNGQTTYSYDALNRLSNIFDFNSNNFSFGYDVLSRRTQLTRPNGITTNYSYDSVSNLLSMQHQQGASTLDGASYTYDSAGNRKSKTNLLNAATSNFSYDNAYQLTAVTGPNPESYSYDPVGNRLTSQSTSNYAYNSSNELTAAGSASYTYDANWNTLIKTDSTGTTTYTWDFENRLTSVQLPNSTVVTFKYDPFGRRIQKNGASTTAYAYDGANVIEEVDQSENLLAHYSQGGGIDEPLSELRSGTISYYEQDGLGSVTSLSSSGGMLPDTYAYDSFGNLSASSGNVTNPYQYTGRDYDPETGLRYYRARYYDPSVGRFINEDSAGFAVDVNFYRYAFNRSTEFVDPNGYSAVPAGQAPNATSPCPFNITDFIDYLDNHAGSKPSGKCATFIRKAIQAGFGQDPTGKNKLGSPVPAKDWGPFLVDQLGFAQVSLEADANGSVTYEPALGDIVVFQPVEGSNKNGHIEAFDGTQFVSDYPQGVPLPNGTHFYPNFKKNGPQPFDVYRYPCK